MYKLTDLNSQSRFNGYIPFKLGKKNKVNVMALGDVGGTVVTGLRLLGADVIDEIGLCDINYNMAKRYEIEMNQIAFPFDSVLMPKATAVESGDLFNCDVFVFCASKAIPKLGSEVKDVRMAQFNENRKIIEEYAKMAVRSNFKGLFAVVSDPVDPLCKAAFIAGGGELCNEQIKGFGLGVMNARALYYAKKNECYKSYLKEGRAFGPHGLDLIIANSLMDYNDEISKELTKLTIQANLEVRDLGFKPYIAPAISSAAISLILTLRGEWNYSSNYIGQADEGAYFGSLNRMTNDGVELENKEIPSLLFERIKNSYDNLKAII
ncbi:MAG: lactate/malate family dehydrogenase [Aminipila sp.]